MVISQTEYAPDNIPEKGYWELFIRRNMFKIGDWVYSKFNRDHYVEWIRLNSNLRIVFYDSGVVVNEYLKEHCKFDNKTLLWKKQENLDLIAILYGAEDE